MSEELEKKEKPKATLIKHNKQETSSGASKVEKKKVVVVKKKKKPVVKAVQKSAESNSDIATTKKTAANKEIEETKRNSSQKIFKNDARPVGGSRKGRSQDDIFGNKPSESATSDNNAQSNTKPSQNEDNIKSVGNKQGNTGFSRPNSNNNRYTGSMPSGNYRQGSNSNYRSNTSPQGGRDDGNRNSGYQGRQTYNRNYGRPDDTRPNYQGTRPNGQGTRPNGQGTRPNSQGTRPPGNYRPGGYREQSGSSQGRYTDNRNTNRQGGYNSRPNNFRGKPGAPPRTGDFRGKPAAGGIPAPNAENKKTIGRKVFKAKKKNDYKKKNDFEKEKDFQIKKKTVQRVNPVPSQIEMLEAITVSDLARKMNLKASELIAKLMGMGMMVTINKQIDVETAELIAADYNCKIKRVSLYDETIIESDKDTEGSLQTRAPIVAVMGHVDHGKTKLLDALRKTDVVAVEHGGITQHIGASKISIEGRGSIVFLDTPGHEAFTLMRARGARVTDIVVLIVAANDGVMPQTIEAINHAKEAGVPIVVAINKCDLPDANIDKVKQQLSEYNLMPESWGGSTLFAEISALKGTGIKELIDVILLQAEMLELKATPDCRAEGTVIESRVDHGRGIVSSVIIERGTIRIGDSFVAGVYPGKVRALFDDKGDKLNEAGPATPVEILGFTGVPNAGSPFQVTENEKAARMVGEKRQELEKLGRADSVSKVNLDNLYASIQEGSLLELKVIIKGDVHGSVEALQSSLKKLSTDEIKLIPIHAAAGAIVENDVNLASASNAIIIGFHVRPTPKALLLAEREKVDIRKYNIIYDAVADIKSAMEGMLSPELSEETLGTVEVREVFKVPKIGLIAGCYVKSGKVRRGEKAHVIREGVILHSGKITSLKRFKDDAKEVDAGFECGIGIENYLDVKAGDEFEVYTIKETARNLD